MIHSISSSTNIQSTAPKPLVNLGSLAVLMLNKSLGSVHIDKQQITHAAYRHGNSPIFYAIKMPGLKEV